MTDSWHETSEMVAGLVISGKLSVNAVRPEMFFPPIDEVIKLYKSGTVGPEELSEICGFSVVSSLMEAASAVNGSASKLDWIRKLEMSYSNYSSGDELEKLGKRMKRGEKVDLSHLNTIAAKSLKGETTLVQASKVTPREMPFIPCGYAPIDEHLGGIALAGVTLIGAYVKVGKTSLAIRLQKSFLTQYPDKKVAFFSLEMLNEEIRMRGSEIADFTEDELERWILCDEPNTAEQVINKAATIEDLGMVVIDFADMMIQGEGTEPQYTMLYKTLAMGAKSLRVPIILLAQFSGSYSGGVPRPYHFRWSRLAEALASTVITLWNPDKDPFASDEDLLPQVEGKSYICCWLVRGGFRIHKEDNPGAIQIPFRGDKGWHPTVSKWFVMRTDKPRKQYTKR